MDLTATIMIYDYDNSITSTDIFNDSKELLTNYYPQKTNFQPIMFERTCNR